MQVQPLGREDPLEEEMATHFSPLAWRIPTGLQGAGHACPTEHSTEQSKHILQTELCFKAGLALSMFIFLKFTLIHLKSYFDHIKTRVQ